MEPDVLRALADAIEAIQRAKTLTDHGFVSDHCDNALVELAKAVRAGTLENQ